MNNFNPYMDNNPALGPSYGYPYPVRPTVDRTPQTPGTTPQVPPNGFNCRPVTSREEAVAAQTDYFSAGVIMPDLGHGMIYIKRFNQNTGSSDFLEFAYQQPQPVQQTTPGQWVSVDDFNALAERIERLEAAGKDRPTSKSGTKKGEEA